MFRRRKNRGIGKKMVIGKATGYICVTIVGKHSIAPMASMLIQIYIGKMTEKIIIVITPKFPVIRDGL